MKHILKKNYNFENIYDYKLRRIGLRSLQIYLLKNFEIIDSLNNSPKVKYEVLKYLIRYHTNKIIDDILEDRVNYKVPQFLINTQEKGNVKILEYPTKKLLYESNPKRKRG